MPRPTPNDRHWHTDSNGVQHEPQIKIATELIRGQGYAVEHENVCSDKFLIPQRRRASQPLANCTWVANPTDRQLSTTEPGSWLQAAGKKSPQARWWLASFLARNRVYIAGLRMDENDTRWAGRKFKAGVAATFESLKGTKCLPWGCFLSEPSGESCLSTSQRETVNLAVSELVSRFQKANKRNQKSPA